MKKQLLSFLFASGILLVSSQANINSWHLNTTGIKGSYWNSSGTKVNMSDSAGITKLCYTTSSIYIKCKGLADDYTMGPKVNPNDPSATSYTFKMPKSPSQQTGTKSSVPTGGAVGLATNGVVLYGNRSADSYKSSTQTNTSSGDGKWHCDAWYNEGTTMDTSGNGHATNSGAYHYHANPTTLYSDPATAHSPIIGFALDGYPIYGPYGYSSATNSSSAIARMKSSYQMRSITTRTVLPDGTTSSPAGPAVSTTFPLGMYVEDYAYVSGLGDLDELNGRYCVTPEYPSGTYAYFISTDNAGTPAYPYIFATYYYGVISASDLASVGNATIPSTGTTCVTTVSGISNVEGVENIKIYPNPASDKINIYVEDNQYTRISIIDVLGKVVSSANLNYNQESISVDTLESGIYFILLSDNAGSSKMIRVVIE
jgi:hypothetical protein